jgi:adenylate cyclase
MTITPHPISSSPATVLVVDDIPDNSEVLSLHVRKLGHKPVVAGNGAEALQRMRADNFDLILLDVMMPTMTGHEVLEQMHKDPALKSIPVVMVSAVAEVDSVARSIRLGAEDYLFKPINAILLRARIDSCLEKKRLRDTEKEHIRQLEVERATVDRLLQRLYPLPVIERLKNGESPIADAYEDVTVLFADIHDFSRIAGANHPTEVVRLLNQVFSTFDRLAEQCGVEKIKTVGDAYVAACGLPGTNPDHAAAIADLALQMQRETVQFDSRLREPFSLRIGIHTGPVVAGVIGAAKGSYDLWGGTIKIASHMETSGLVGGIQVSEATYKRLRETYLFEERGAFYLRGQGEINTYLLKGKLAAVG